MDEIIKKMIDEQLALTPKDMQLHVEIELTEKGVQLHFTRTKKEE